MKLPKSPTMNPKRTAHLSRLTQIGSAVIAVAAIAALAIRDHMIHPPATPTRVAQATRATGERGSPIVLRSARNLADPSTIESLANRLAAAGVTDVWVQCKQDDSDEVAGGSAFFPSAIAPVAEGFADDRLGRMIGLLDARAIRVWGWVPSFNDESAARDHPEWRAWTADESATDSAGRVEQQAWLCPRNPDAVAYEASLLAEVVARYPRLAGVYTDFIRYDSDHSCVCDRCLAEFAATARGANGVRAISPAQITDAGRTRSRLWQSWTSFRARAICGAVDRMRDAISASRESMWFGACVLPFSAEDYSFNTQSGQDLYEMARVGLDEIVLMGYWDDWGKSPEWLTRCVGSARELLEGECELSCLIDGDMSVHRTCRTLQAVADMPASHIGYFNYGTWTDADLRRIGAASAAVREGSAAEPGFTAVAIRVDTEPDNTGSYDSVRPAMIDRLVDMFDAEGIRATFVTCGKLAEVEPAPLIRAAAHGHEIACHAYDHEQLDSLAVADQLAASDRGFAALRSAGLDVVGFGAPRNSVTPELRDYLVSQGVRYDGSLAFDPMLSYVDPSIHVDPTDPRRSMVIVPFIVPNDWDALRVMGVSPERMLAMWLERLERLTAMRESVVVLDVHQWLASDDAELAVLRSFIRTVASRGDCRIMPLRDAAAHAGEEILACERAASAALERQHSPLRAEASR